MNISARIIFLTGALALTIASAFESAYGAGLKVRYEPENPGLTDARTPALARSTEMSLPALEGRLRETKAISGLKKLGLRSDIDHLMARFRLAHAGGGSAEAVTLREPYDDLLWKIQALLKKDPQLARDIAASQESIWDVLSDRTQFAMRQRG